ncbi:MULTISPECIES: MarR family winged helix-turn-helix transcriptional regulator [Methanobacterium]|uniref:HTH-type transcriptional regulator SarZ n=1 Tax=Methanobacterium veterum TaxID=408577 RepID=A0A9E5DNL5_9EURY|nr:MULTISPECIES: MarR family winged helix-turn-helix transcriptional regulator [Methanobacterium]MCZ3365963.1 MarR family winged helix-turn-helix transcriptional regulator [Methanobacterium veterum]MCZ3371428.1 MarR family winged helix-turn-helix transcriptional regulator [Methanobacterium veterum]
MDVAEIWEYLERVEKVIHSKHHKAAKKYGLTLEQFHLLIELDELELDIISEKALPPTIGEIAADMGNAPHTLSGRIKRLEKKGLIKKIRDEKDLRINRVVFTEKGQDLINTIKKETGDEFIHKAAKMDEKTLKDLLNGLKELNESLSE